VNSDQGITVTLESCPLHLGKLFLSNNFIVNYVFDRTLRNS
jgi:hypothetical protein